MAEQPLDLSTLETRRAELRCWRCGRWAGRLLLTIADRRPVCERCARARLEGPDS